MINIFRFLNVYYRGGVGFLGVCNRLCGTSCIRTSVGVTQTGGSGVGGVS